MTDLLNHFLAALAGFAFYVPKTLLRVVGLFLPPCSDWGITSFAQGITENMAQWIRFYWPVIQYVDWPFVQAYVGCWLLFVVVMWALDRLPTVISWVTSAWWIIVVLYVLAFFFNLWTSYDWTSSAPWEPAFGSNPTTTSDVGGGFGGGGGGSW